MEKPKPNNINEYINTAPVNGQKNLWEIYSILKDAAPNASEKIKWGIPVFEGKRILFSFAAYKSHLNFTPTGPALEPFKKELALYTTRQDSVQFPYDKPLPKDLIRRIAAYRVRDVEENDAKWKY